eukprot:6203884-Pleurochrysis_carterae.AAC.2
MVGARGCVAWRVWRRRRWCACLRECARARSTQPPFLMSPTTTTARCTTATLDRVHAPSHASTPSVVD